MDEPTEKRSPVLIRPPTPADEEAWQQLYRGYADFYGVPMSSEILSTTWSWLLDPEHPLEGLLAVQDDQPIGLAHFRPQPRPLYGETAGFLDDLFVAPANRRTGAARLLLEELARVARSRGWRTVRWITAADNATARRLYDQLASETDWVTYELRS